MSETKLSAMEQLKLESKGLRGTIAEELQSEKPRFSNQADNLMKFHGMYQQKNRDRRKPEEKHLGPKPFTVMVRGRIPGGRLNRAQWLIWDDLADQYSDNGLRLTTRQSIQVHGVLKNNVKETIKQINETLQSTMGACGDVVRNVTQSVNPWGRKDLAALDQVADLLSSHFEVKSNAYYEIFLDDKKVVDETDKIYGDRYLPRKFKIGVTKVGNNNIDLYTHDLAFAATFNSNQEIDGYFVFVGGGMGQSHNDPETYPRLADNLGWIPAESLIPVAEAVVTTQRDFGNRDTRSLARLKYTIAHRGVEWFKGEIESRSAIKFEDKELPEWETPNYLGWHDQENGKKSFGLHLLSGRIVDHGETKLKTAIKDVITQFASHVQVSPEQDLILEDIEPEDVAKVEGIFDSYGIHPYSPHSLLNRAVTCVALPTCVKALAESERVGEDLFSSIAKLVDKHGKSETPPTVRITGCPNGCARPYAAEIGLVGQLPGKYAVYLGGDAQGTRLNKQIAEKKTVPEILDLLDNAFAAWAKDSRTGESFGDFSHRVEYSFISQQEA